MSVAAPARRRTALGAALSVAVLGLVVLAPSADATPPGNPLQPRCSSPAPSFDRTDYAVDGEAVSTTTGDFNKDGHRDVAALTSGLGGYYAVILRGDGQGVLGGKSSHEVGQDPVDVAAADLSGDGYDELAVSHNSPGVPSFEVGKNNTAGGFDFASYNGNSTAGLVPGDFDDDGKLDMAASAGSGLEVWPGQGDGSFGAVRGYPTGTAGQGVAAGDFNGDGRLDAVTANRDADTVSVLLQTATGFAPAISLPVHDAPYAVTVGDFDDDGNPDIAVANNYAGPSGEVRVVDILLGDGDGGFVATESPEVGDGQDIVSGDFNHDGDLDLALLREYSNVVSVISGNGDGTFTGRVNVAVGRDPRSISVADFNEDGLDDLVSANWYDGSVSVLLNTSRPTNVDPDAEADSYTATTNGVLSVPGPGVLANDSDDDCDPLTASVAAGPGHGVVDLDVDGSFTYTPTSGYVGADSFTYRAHDGLGGKSEPTTVTLNVSTVDAVDDTATAVEGAAPLVIDVLANDSDTDTSGGALTITAVTQPAYGSVVITGTGSGLSYTAPDDFVGPDPFTYTVTNGAGRTDTGTVTVTVGAARGCATVDFAAPRQAGQLLVPAYLVGSGDLNGDGSVDVASFQWDPQSLQIAYNNGSGDFPSTTVLSSAYTPEGPSFGDLNSDGRLDVVQAAGSNHRMIVTYGANGGLTGATTVHVVLDDREPGLTVIGDVDEDGAPDVVASEGFRGSSDRSVFAVVKGDGLGGFTLQPDIDGPATRRLTLVDIDGDGHLDLVGSDRDGGRVWVNLGDGDAGFGPATPYDVGTGPVQHVTVDFDGDGNLDIATVNAASRDLSVLYGDGTGGFAPAIQLAAGPTVGVGANLAAADVNADGRPDLVTVQGKPGTVNVFLSRGAGGFAPRQLFGTGSGAITGATTGDFNGDGSVDVAVANEAGVLRVLDNQCTTRIRPTAVHDTYVTGEDTGLDVHTPGLLGNDTYGGAVTVSVSEGDGPSHGEVDVDPAGSFTYTPDDDFTGRDTFTYKVDDGHGGTDTATVNLTVRPSQDGPVAVDDGATVPQDAGATTVDVLANDTDVDGDELTVTAVTQGAHGAATITSAGADASYEPVAGYFGTDSFAYAISDGHGGTDTATVNITIPRSNTAPVANDDELTVAQDAAATTVDVLVDDTDAENDALTVTGITQGAHGAVAITNTGADVSYKPAAGYFGTDSFTYSISDGFGGSDTATVNVTVPRSNTAPVANDDELTVAQDAAATTVDVLVDDADAENDSLTVTSVTQGAHGTVANTTAGADVSYKPAAGYFGTDSFTYTVSDGFGGTDTATVNVTVTQAPPPNTAPVATDDTLSVAQDSVASTVNVLANDDDADDDSLTVTTVTQGAHGTVAITNAGADVSYKPAAGYFGTDSFTYTISDGHGGTDTATVNVTVTQTPPPDNHEPVATDDTLTAAQDSGANTIAVLANDTDADNDSLSVTGITQGAHGTVTITHTGADVSYSPAAGFHGTDTFTYTVDDGRGGTDTATVNVTVTQMPPSARRKLTVLSYDVGRSTARPGHRWVQRRHAAADLIARSGAQVIGLQGTPRRERAGRRTVHPIADLRARLPEFGAVVGGPRLRIPNVLLYRTSELRALSSGTARLSAGVHRTRRCAKVSPASATWALLQDRDTQQTYFVVDANLSRGFRCSRQRGVETQKLMTRVRQANATHAPVVLLGGLNAGRSESAPRLIDRSLDPTVPLSRATPTYNTFWDARWANDTRRLDYVFHSAELTVSRPGVIRDLYVLGRVRSSPSSHYAVRATFTSP